MQHEDENSPWWSDFSTSNSDRLWHKLEAIMRCMRSQQQSRMVSCYEDLLYTQPYDYDSCSAAFSIMRNVFPYASIPERTPRDTDINIISGYVSTFCSKHAATKPSIRVLTERGNYTLQKKAKDLEKIINGEFKYYKFYKKLATCVRECAQMGSSFLFVGMDGPRLKIENVPIFEVLVEEMDAMYGDPQCIARRRIVARSALYAAYPEHESLIAEIPQAAFFAARDNGSMQQSEALDVVCVNEIWKKSIGDIEGRYACWTEGAVLANEPYASKYLPFAWLTLEKQPYTIYGYGIARIAKNIQDDFNDLNNLKKQQVTAPPGIVIAFDDNMDIKTDGAIAVIKAINPANVPVVLPMPAISPALVETMRADTQLLSDTIGLSQTAVGGRKAAGVDSGAALRELNDIESNRFAHFADAIDEFAVDVAEKALECMRLIHKEHGSYVHISPEENVTDLSFGGADLAEERYSLGVYASGFLRTQPAGRKQDVYDFISNFPEYREMAPKLLDFPDLSAAMQTINAEQYYAEAVVEKMANGKEGELDAAMPMSLLQKIYNQGMSRYYIMKNEGASQEECSVLFSGVRRVADFLQGAQQQAIMEQQQQMMAEQQGAMQPQMPQ